MKIIYRLEVYLRHGGVIRSYFSTKLGHEETLTEIQQTCIFFNRYTDSYRWVEITLEN